MAARFKVCARCLESSDKECGPGCTQRKRPTADDVATARGLGYSQASNRARISVGQRYQDGERAAISCQLPDPLPNPRQRGHSAAMAPAPLLRLNPRNMAHPLGQQHLPRFSQRTFSPGAVSHPSMPPQGQPAMPGFQVYPPAKGATPADLLHLRAQLKEAEAQEAQRIAQDPAQGQFAAPPATGTPAGAIAATAPGAFPPPGPQGMAISPPQQGCPSQALQAAALAASLMQSAPADQAPPQQLQALYSHQSAPQGAMQYSSPSHWDASVLQLEQHALQPKPGYGWPPGHVQNQCPPPLFSQPTFVSAGEMGALMAYRASQASQLPLMAASQAIQGIQQGPGQASPPPLSGGQLPPPTFHAHESAGQSAHGATATSNTTTSTSPQPGTPAQDPAFAAATVTDTATAPTTADKAAAEPVPGAAPAVAVAGALPAAAAGATVVREPVSRFTSMAQAMECAALAYDCPTRRLAIEYIEKFKSGTTPEPGDKPSKPAAGSKRLGPEARRARRDAACGIVLPAGAGPNPTDDDSSPDADDEVFDAEEASLAPPGQAAVEATAPPPDAEDDGPPEGIYLENGQIFEHP